MGLKVRVADEEGVEVKVVGFQVGEDVGRVGM